MTHSNQILYELQSISQVVADIPVEYTYRVPSDYFDSLADHLLNRIATMEDIEIHSSLSQYKHTNPFTVPGDYFNGLPGIILDRVKSGDVSFNDEAEILSPELSKLTKSNPFRVPAEYFEEFPSVMLKRIESEESSSDSNDLEALSPLMGQLKKTIAFKLPEGYFQEFPSDVIAGVNAVDYVNQELESFPPVMNDLKIKNVYNIPEGYFDNLGEQLLDAVKHRKKASVVSITFTRKVLRYAIAALVVGCMSVAAWMFYQNKPAVIPGTDLAKISDDEMLDYLETTPVTTVENVGTALFTMKEEDVKEILADVPDDELQQYLEQHALSKDLIIN